MHPKLSAHGFGDNDPHAVCHTDLPHVVPLRMERLEDTDGITSTSIVPTLKIDAIRKCS